jgi:DNA repair protein RecO (recombination protein O)
MLRRTEAIVLRTMPFSEADLIVTVLSSDYGVLKTFAKSPRKVKSRFGSSLEPLTWSRISFWGKEDAALPRLTQSDIIRPFQPLRDNLDSFFRAAEIAELTLSLLAERETCAEVFSLFRGVLDRIEACLSGKDGGGRERNGLLDRIVLFYKVRLLDLTGYGPALDGCARCRRKGYDFYLSQGSIVCSACARGLDTPMKLSMGAVKLYETMRRWEVEKIERIRPSGKMLAELSDLLNAHFRYTVARPLKAKTLAGYPPARAPES